MQESYFLSQKEENKELNLARVIFASTDHYRILVLGETNDRLAKLRGHFFNGESEFPVVGDWVSVAVQPGDHQAIPIESLLPRVTEFRKSQGGTQTLMANVDKIALVTSFNRDFNLRRLERGLAMIADSGAQALIALNKVDLVDQEQRDLICAQLSERLSGIPVLICSGTTKEGLQELIQQFDVGQTVAFIGMSGVGKSTLINHILGETQQTTSEIREDDSRGRHTTTHRELFQTAHGFWILDSPGTRQFALAGDEESLDQSFEDLSEIMTMCRFQDCSHETEPGCQIQEALSSGLIPEDRWQNYLKMRRELERQNQKNNKAFQSQQKKQWAKRSQNIRQILKEKGKK